MAMLRARHGRCYFTFHVGAQTEVKIGSGARNGRSTLTSPRAEGESNSLVVELLDTWRSFDSLSQLTSFEDNIFGPDFAIAPERMRTWADSGSWVCAAVTGQAVVGRQQIFSLLSILVTTAESRDLLLSGKITESDLQPWTHNPLDEKPALYLSSVVSMASEHLAIMYQSVATDLAHFRSTWETDFSGGFCIASGPAGFSHMSRNGFRSVEANKYRGHYPMMVIDATSAATRFWQELFLAHHDDELAAPSFPSVHLAP